MEKFTYKQIKEMYELQIKQNEQIHKEWYKQGYDWDLAIKMETAEAIDSLNWKHWKNLKNEKIDLDNFRVELVDIFHFILSKEIEYWLNEDEYEHEVDIYDTIMTDFDLCLNKHNTNNDTLLSITKKFFKSDLEDPFIENSYGLFFAIFDKLDMSTEELYKSYIIKNLLNQHRQNNGYKEGIYKKIWEYENKEVEDNVVVFELSSKIETNEDFSDNLKKAIENVYKLQKDK